MGFYCFCHRQLLLESFSIARQRGVQLFVAGLEADLNMVQTGLCKRIDFLFRQPDPGGDQVGVKTQITRSADELRQVFTHQRFAAGETDLHRAHFPRFFKHLDPLGGGQFFFLFGEIERVRAIRTLQRAAVSQFGQQPQWRFDRRFKQVHGR